MGRAVGAERQVALGRLQRESPLDYPVSLIMRHGQGFYLRCLKYMRQSVPSVVSPIMRQVHKPLMLSDQVSDAGASSR